MKLFVLIGFILFFSCSNSTESDKDPYMELTISSNSSKKSYSVESSIVKNAKAQYQIRENRPNYSEITLSSNDKNGFYVSFMIVTYEDGSQHSYLEIRDNITDDVLVTNDGGQATKIERNGDVGEYIEGTISGKVHGGEQNDNYIFKFKIKRGKDIIIK